MNPPVNAPLPPHQPQLSANALVTALNVVEESLIWTDAIGRIEYCNQAAERLLHASLQQLYGQSLIRSLPLQQAGKALKPEEHPVKVGLSTAEATSSQNSNKFQLSRKCYQLYLPQDPSQCSPWITVTTVALPVDDLDVPPKRLFVIRRVETPEPHPPEAVAVQENLTQRYQQALEITQVGIWDWEIATATATWSTQALELLGLPAGKPANYSTWRRCVHPKDIDRVEAAVTQALDTHGNYEAEYRVIYPDGSLHWMLARGRGIYNAQGQALRMIGVLMDVSDRKRNEVVLKLAEAAWQENQQILDAIMTNLPSGVFRCLCSLEGKLSYVYASAGYQNLFGLDPHTLSTQPQAILERIHPEDRSHWLTLMQPDQSSPNSKHYWEYRVILLNGEEKWLARTTHFSQTLRGQTVIDGIDVDITDRKQAEAALAASQQFIQKIAEAMPGVLYVYDLIDHQSIYTNREIESVLGYTAAEIQSFDTPHLARWLHPEDHPAAQAYFEQFAQLPDGAKVGWEYRFRHADGSWRWLHSQDTIFARTASGQPRLILGTTLDITERKRTEFALRSILQGTAATTGEAFFAVLVENLANALGVRHAFVSELLDQQLQTLAFWSDHQIQPNRVFDLAVSPCCRIAIEQGFACFPEQVQQVFPTIPALTQLQAESYLGVVMLDGSGQALGTLCIVDDRPLQDAEHAEAILRIFAARAAAELERQRATIALQQLNQQLEARVEQRTQELMALLDEKEVLLKEVHHRVKNNLQMIQSLLSLQMRSLEDPSILEVLAESQRRIRAMTLVHEKLYQSDHLAQINFAEYARSLTRDLLQSCVVDTAKIQLSIEIADLEMAIDTAIACGLIINELFSNAIKYAFPDHRSGVIAVQFRPYSEGLSIDEPIPRYILQVSDNGVGIAEEVDIFRTKSLGLRLVHALTRQLRGILELERHTGTTSGTTFTITFAKPT